MTTLDLNIGARVSCRDGQCGKLAKVVLDPESLKVSGLIVEEGFLLRQAHVFPFNKIEFAGPDDIYLAIDVEDLDKYPEYHETEFERPASDWQGYSNYPLDNVRFPILGSGYLEPIVPTVKEKIREGISSELEVVMQGTEVRGEDGVIGRLDHVVTHKESNTITHLVVRRGAIFTEQLVIPVSRVQQVSEDGIYVAATYDELEAYARSAAEEATLNTNEQTAAANDHALSADTKRVSDVSTALTADARTSDLVIEIINDRGVITLAGTVPDQESRQTAEEIAARQPGVITVINSLKVR